MIHNSIKHFKEGEVTDSSLPPGTIITIDGQQYIVNTNIGKGNSIKQEMDNQTYILTMDVATKVSESYLLVGMKNQNFIKIRT